MSLQNQYSLYAVRNNDATTLHCGVQSLSTDAGLSLLLRGGDGAIYNQLAAVQQQAPVSRFTTLDLSMLSTCGLEGAAITSNGLDFYWRARALGGLYAATSSHLKIRINKGLWVPETISASQDGPASLTYAVVAIASGDGTAQVAPWTLTEDQALPSGTQTVASIYTLGPVMINGTQVQGVQGVDVAFGIGVDVQASDGQVYPTWASIVTAQPSIQVRFRDAETWEDFKAGVAQGATDSVVYFRPYTEGGTRATTNAISLTIDEGMITAGEISGSHGESAVPVITITPTWDGTALPLVIATNASIPANL